MHFQQIRSATSIVTFAGKRFLIDPMLGEKYQVFPVIPDTVQAGPGNPTSDLPCPVENLFAVDAVIATHLHFDHFDEEAKRLLPKDLPIFSQSKEESDELAKCGFKDVRVLTDEGVQFGDITLYRTECEHGGSNACTMAGYAAFELSEKASGVIFESSKENCRFYLAGDTIYTQDVADTVRRFKPGIIAVNCAGAQFPLGHLIIMNQYDVLQLMRDFPDADVVATHLDGVSHASVDSKLLREFKSAKGLSKLWIPASGESIELNRTELNCA